MLTSLQIILEKPQKEKVGYWQSTLFHGYLMEQIDSMYAKHLHGQSLRPYSQSIKAEKEHILWKINGLNQEAYENIILPLFQKETKEILLKHQDISLKMQDKKLEKTDYGKLFQNNYILEDKEPYLTFSFLTPATFKRAGDYVRFPEVRLIMNSLLTKYNAFSDVTTLGETEPLLEEYQKKLYLSRYQLKSTSFPMEGIKIPSFQGTITFKIKGNSNLKNLTHMLFDFGEFSGMGIKTALGMGAIKVERGDAK